MCKRLFYVNWDSSCKKGGSPPDWGRCPTPPLKATATADRASKLALVSWPRFLGKAKQTVVVLDGNKKIHPFFKRTSVITN